MFTEKDSYQKKVTNQAFNHQGRKRLVLCIQDAISCSEWPTTTTVEKLRPKIINQAVYTQLVKLSKSNIISFIEYYSELEIIQQST